MGLVPKLREDLARRMVFDEGGVQVETLGTRGVAWRCALTAESLQLGQSGGSELVILVAVGVGCGALVVQVGPSKGIRAGAENVADRVLGLGVRGQHFWGHESLFNLSFFTSNPSVTPCHNILKEMDQNKVHQTEIQRCTQ